MNRRNNRNRPFNYTSLLQQRPQAWAMVQGSRDYPGIQGNVRFYQTPRGVLVSAEFVGLPNPSEICRSPVFGFHIHEGDSCTGTREDPFADVRMHYNPYNCPHPYHVGDLPPLFGVNGYAFSVFLTNRFTVREIVGKTVIVHGSPDDFTTQPSGNAGTKMACGQIRG